MLAEIFGSDMTSVASRCAHCGNRAMVGSMRAYGMPARVSCCAARSAPQMVMRVMRRPDGTFLVDARGAAYLRM